MAVIEVVRDVRVNRAVSTVEEGRNEEEIALTKSRLV